MPLDVVADHDRVVHVDAHRHQEGEHREHVEGLIAGKHQRPCAEHRHRHAHRHPEADLEVEEQRQDHEHDQQALGAVRQQHVEPLTHVQGGVGTGDEFVARRQPRLGHIAFHSRHHREQIFARTAIDRDDESLPAVDPALARHVGKPVADGAQITHREHEAVGQRDQRNLRDLAPHVLLVFAPQQHLAPLTADRAAGQFEILAADDVGHGLEGEAVLPQRVLRDLDRDLVFLAAGDIDR